MHINPKAPGRNVIAVAKANGERFIFLWDQEPESYPALMRALGRQAGNPELSINWTDAAVLSQKARQLQKAHS